MKHIVSRETVSVEPFVCIAFDASKLKLDYHTKVAVFCQQTIMEGTLKNRIKDITEVLNEIKAEASKFNIHKIMVVCESTGGYEKRLLETAAALGMEAHYVGSKTTKMASNIQTNDFEKTDEKDARSIHLVAAGLGKTMKFRPLKGVYRELRELSDWYNEVNDRICSLKTQIHFVMEQLFSELDYKPDYLFENVAQAIMQCTGFDPRRIVALGKDGFVAEVKKINKMAQRPKLVQIFEDAVDSIRPDTENIRMDIYARRLKHTYDQWLVEAELKNELGDKMHELYLQTEEYEKLADFEDIPERQMARIIAETGPLSDFKNHKQLLRFAGLNLCRRESGTYKGQTSISKSGRIPLRYILYQAVWASQHLKNSLIAKYMKKKRSEKMIFKKIMTSCMRKVLKIVFGAFNSKQGYDRDFYELQLTEQKCA